MMSLNLCDFKFSDSHCDNKQETKENKNQTGLKNKFAM